MKETFVNSQKLTTKKWYVIDAKDQILGRLATQATTVLMGKNKNTYTPFLENGDYVIIINAEKIKITGKKDTQKLYRNHSGYPSGMRIEKFSSLIENVYLQTTMEHPKVGRIQHQTLVRNTLGRT